MASCSSANSCYDVFLSFRGTDTRNNFISHLYSALCGANVKVFIDDKINRGEYITEFLMKIIEGAKISIIVFSSDYASSPSCLDELVKIMECKKSKQQFVLPIFYKVRTSVKIYKKALIEHKLGEETVDKEKKVERWESSLQRAFKLAGHHIDEHKKEATVIEEIKREVLERLKCQFVGEMKCTPLVGETSEDYLEIILQCLMRDENSIVGVWGMGGVGKTTIVSHINNRLLNDATFSPHIYWVTVSKDLSVYELQGNIAKQIELDFFGEDNESKRAAKLFNELKRINKFVLILDDIWEHFETEEVGIPLMGERKILLTTRYLRVCQRMMCESIEVKPLFENEALDLFMKESKSQINDSGERREIVQSIVKECAGLPLAIVAVARTMRGIVEIQKWRNTLRELQKPYEGENPEIKEKVFKVLKFSYDRLPNDRCRQCYLYCSLFPEDHEFRRDYLIEYWIGEGLIDELDSRQAELDKGNEILDELIQSSLLGNNGKPYKQLKMHDVFRDMTRMNVKIGSQFESVRVLKMLETSPNSTSHCSKLNTLVLQGDYIKELSGSFFASIRSLNVLHISHMNNVTSIPDSIANLENLRLLIIHHCMLLSCIPSLVGLENLRHLNISMTGLEKIPKGINRLVNLRVLNLSGNESLSGSFQSGVLEKLSHLQTLNLERSRVEVDPKVLISLEKLEILRVSFYNVHKLNCYLKSRHWRRLLEYHFHYGGLVYDDWTNKMWLKKMSFQANKGVEDWKGESGVFLPDDIQHLYLNDWKRPMFYYFNNPNFVNLRSIHIHKYKCRYLFTVDLAHLLHNVQSLTIDVSYYELEEIIGREEYWGNQNNCVNYPTILLPSLNTLKLGYLPRLSSIYRGRMVCPSLEFIYIGGCHKLERLPFCLEKDGNKQNPTIKIEGATRWWDSLLWDDPNTKSMYQHLK